MKTSRAKPAWELEGSARFELRRSLGSGAFGAVFEVFDRERRAKVALKLLRRADPEDIYRFKHEFRALADIAHPNVVHLYELLTDGDRWFFTMELVEGANALAFVRRGHDIGEAPTMLAPFTASNDGDDRGVPPAPRFDELRLRSVLAQLVEGLVALHRAGKMHRDVKPSNVLVTHDGRVVLVDFGLAVRLSRSAEQSRSALVGTPVYLAPEMILGQPSTEAGDFYAVGVLLYEALTGRPPFAGSIAQILAMKVAHDPPAPSALVPDVPADLDRLCAELLSRSPSARPRGEDLLDRVGGVSVPRSGAREVSFVGRAVERAGIAEIFAAGRRERCAALALVGGPSGIGKSALVRQVIADLRDAAPDAVILDGRCWEQESVPYKAIDGLVDPLSRHLEALPTHVAASLLPADVHMLARLFPVLARVAPIAEAPASAETSRDARELRRGAFRALRDLLARVAEQHPLVLVIDDLQWGDEDSGALLLDLLSPPDPPPLLLIASYRSDETETSACLRTALPALNAMRGTCVRVLPIELRALAEDEAYELALASLPATRDNESRAAMIAKEAGGRPFFIRELAELSRARRGGGPEVSLDALVRARAAELPDGARRLLEVVAIAGRPVDRAAAARAAGLGDDEPAVYGLLRIGRLVRKRDSADHDEIETYHDRIREAVAAGISAARRKEVFLALALALDEAGTADAATLAVYFLEGGERARAAELKARAAFEAARSLAFDRAARLYRRALDLGSDDDPGRAALQESLGDALVNAGRGAEAAVSFSAAAEASTPDRAIDLRRRAAEQLLFAGHVDEGTVAFQQVLSEIGERFPTTMVRVAMGIVGYLILMMLWSLRGYSFRPRREDEVPTSLLRRIDGAATAMKAFSNVDSLVGAYFCGRAAYLALSAGEPRRIFEALTNVVGYGNALGHDRPRYVREAQKRAQAIARDLGEPRYDAMMHMIEGVSRVMLGDSPSGLREIHQALLIFRERCTGAVWEMNTAQEYEFVAYLWTGAWKEIADELPRRIDEARACGNRHLERGLLLRVGHAPRLLADDPAGAHEVHASARSGWWPPRFGTLDYFWAVSRADVLLYEEHGCGALAREELDPLWKSANLRQWGPIEFWAIELHNARFRASLALAASDVSRRSDAIAVARQSARRLAGIRNPLAHALSVLAAASLAHADGQLDEASLRFAEAETALDAVGCAHYAAAARIRRGSILGGEEGRVMVSLAEASLGAKNPSRLASALAPSGRA